jgi:ATP/maltotriose-dependent transcriptional regulator MalT
LVELVEDGRRRQLRAVHPLHVEVARSTMSEPMRRGSLDALADALEAQGCRRRDDVRRLATWRLDAGRPADAVVLVDAAREALWGADTDMCERFARAALDHDDLDDNIRLAAVHLLGTALDDQGRFEAAEEVMAAHEPQAGTGSDRTMLALARAANLFRGLGRHDDALQVLKEADAAVTEAHLHEELLAERASFAVFSGRVDEALELAAPLLQRSDDRAYCQSALQASVASTLSGKHEAAIEIATEAFERRIRLGDQVQMAEPGIYLVALALAQLDAGRIIDGYHTAVAAYEGAVSLGDRHGQAWLSVVLSRAELFRGRLQDALRHAREAALVFGELRHPGTRWGFGALALAAGQLGDAETAATAIEDLDAEPPTPLTLMDIDLERGRVWALVAAGRLSAARRALVPLADQARARGQLGMEVSVLHDLARLGEPAPARDRLLALQEVVDGDLVRIRAAHASALCADDGAALDSVAQRFSATGAELWAAETATAAAAAHRRAGASRAAAAADQSAARWRSLCQGAGTPALATASTSEELTRREREVAGLATQGLSNREIADHLVVSVRTVENHLQRVYTKLGVGSREELRAVLA